MRSKTLSLIAAALAALVAIPALGSVPAQAATKAEQARAQRANVYVQGDSLTVGAGPIIKQHLGHSVHNVIVDAQVGRFTATGMNRLAHSANAKRALVWVVALGTNDGPDPSALKRHVTRSLKLAGPQRDVIWLTVERPGNYAGVNRMLRKLDAVDEQLHVVDWAREVHQNPGLIGGDGVHGTARGYQVRGAMIAREALALAQQG